MNTDPEFAAKDVEDATQFLQSHYRYPTMNHWNGSRSYARNVKAYNLEFPKEIEDLARGVAVGGVSCPALEADYERLKEEFEEETGYTVAFNGRSNGYLVLYGMQEGPNGKPQMSYENVDFLDDPDDPGRIVEGAELVRRFDRFVDDVIDALEYRVAHSRLVEKTYCFEYHRRILVDEDAA